MNNKNYSGSASGGINAQANLNSLSNQVLQENPEEEKNDAFNHFLKSKLHEVTLEKEKLEKENKQLLEELRSLRVDGSTKPAQSEVKENKEITVNKKSETTPHSTKYKPAESVKNKEKNNAPLTSSYGSKLESKFKQSNT